MARVNKARGERSKSEAAPALRDKKAISARQR